MAALISTNLSSQRILPSPTQPAPPAPPKSDKPQPRLRPKAAAFWTIGVILILGAMIASQFFGEERTEIGFSEFDAQVRAHNVKSIDVHGPVAYGEFNEPLIQTETEPPKSSAKDAKPAKTTTHLIRKFSVTLPSDKVDAEFVRLWRESGVKSIE